LYTPCLVHTAPCTPHVWCTPRLVHSMSGAHRALYTPCPVHAAPATPIYPAKAQALTPAPWFVAWPLSKLAGDTHPPDLAASCRAPASLPGHHSTLGRWTSPVRAHKYARNIVKLACLTQCPEGHALSVGMPCQ